MFIYVIVPIYNVEKYLRKCLDSLFDQTFNNYNVICVNDGSTDNSSNILKEYGTHKNLLVINKENGGLSSARNVGLDNVCYSDDTFITFVDSDDYVAPDYLEKLAYHQQQYNADIVCSSYYDLYEDGHHDKAIFNSDVVLRLNRFESLKLLFSGNIKAHGPCKLYSSYLFEKLRYNVNISFMEDQDLSFKIMSIANNVINIPYAGYYYLHHIGSLCQSKMTNKKIIDAMDVYKSICDYDFANIDNSGLLKRYIYQNYSDIFLMMLPRFNAKEATQEEKEKWSKHKHFFKDEKMVFKYKPKTKKQFIKKYTYIIFPYLYNYLFSFFFKEYDR